MKLPPEVIPLVFRSLSKSDLKSARQVSKPWSMFASDLLFESIYISGNQVDVDVFLAVAKHEALRGCVRRLLYDAVGFHHEFSRLDYLTLLSRGWNSWVVSRDCPWPPFSPHHPEVTGFLNNEPRNDSVHPYFKQPGEVQYIRYRLEEGYRKYQEHSRHQQHLLDSGELAAALAYGLHRFSKLTSVHFGSIEWEDIHLGRARTGSALARSWDPWHCRPNVDFWRDERLAREQPAAGNGSEQYRLLVGALIRCKKDIKELNIGSDTRNGLPVWIFDRQTMWGAEVAQLATVVQCVQRFVLHMPLLGQYVKTPEIWPNIEGLALLLGSMANLEDLDLYLPDEDSDGMPTYYAVGKVFPRSISLNKLESLKIRCISASPAELLHCWKKQLPSLKQLAIGEMVLTEGTWRQVFEYLQLSKRLDRFSLDLDLELVLWCNGREDLYIDNLPDDIKRELERFVVEGGTNPFNVLDEASCDDSDSEDTVTVTGDGTAMVMESD